ncbi:RNA methyltransferase [Variovorax sp.]|uniref:RNA methyltransferase n=1 Tax=Variovorax sp. TaxID=1871043 RepID=UPI002D6AEE89|nr:TrmH family RNA methyltransferase [Variovorax sp.]HYP83966.1 TrmH family RNA methyltransferase [Variovorax sp.]
MKTRFILIQTSHAGNVGAAARAMRTMAFDDLVLVAPRWPNVLRREETLQRASGALDVLARARIVETLDEALDGITHMCATAMVPRDFGPPTRSPREHLGPLAAGPEQHVAFLFGSERFGMRNEDVYRCHVALSIPTAPDFGSLNLGAAIQVIAYEWRQALGGFGVREAAATAQAADAQAVAGMLAHWERSLVEIGFLDPAAPKKLMPRLAQLFNRAQPTTEEIHILRGIAKMMVHPQPPRAAAAGGAAVQTPATDPEAPSPAGDPGRR